MKRFLLFMMSTLAIASASHAQITKGTILLGGFARASTYTTKGSPTTEKEKGFTLSPSAGFTVRDNQVLGVSLLYGHGTTRRSDVRLTNNVYGGGLFYRRYLPIGKSFYFFGNGDARYSYSQNKSSPDAPFSSSGKEKTGSINLYPGITYAVSKRFHLEVAMNDLLSFGYTDNHYQWSAPGNTPIDDRYENLFFESRTSLSTNLVVGFRFLLQKDPAKRQTNTPK
jgi:hypothetical protein